MTKLTDGLVAYQAGQKQKTIDTLERAKRIIEQEMAEHGYYPYNGGRLSKLEVLRRAGVSSQTLKNATHRETAESLTRWISQIKEYSPTRVTEVEDVKANKIKALEAKLDDLANHYNSFKLEYNDLVTSYDIILAENIRLKRQLAEVT